MSRVVAGALLAIVASGAWAAEETAKVTASWQAAGRIFEVEADKLLFHGTYAGLLFVEDGAQTFDTATLLCPVSHEIDVKAKQASGSGRCIIVMPDGESVYARFSCSGAVGACAGEFKLVGGTGRYAGISGGGPFRSRTGMAAFAHRLGPGAAISEADGLITWPALKYRLK